MAKLSHTHRLLKHIYGPLEIRDASDVLQIFPNEADGKNAVRADPRKCFTARAITRQLGATSAIILKQFAYVDHPGNDGTRRIYRYAMTTPLCKAIAYFDRHGRFNPEYRFLLRPPKQSMKIATIRHRQKQWRRSDAGQAIIVEQNAKKRVSTAELKLESAKETYDRLREREKPHSVRLQAARIALTQARRDLSNRRLELTSAIEAAEEVRVKAHKHYRPHRERALSTGARSGHQWLGFEAKRLSSVKKAA